MEFHLHAWLTGMKDNLDLVEVQSVVELDAMHCMVAMDLAPEFNAQFATEEDPDPVLVVEDGACEFTLYVGWDSNDSQLVLAYRMLIDPGVNDNGQVINSVIEDWNASNAVSSRAQILESEGGGSEVFITLFLKDPRHQFLGHYVETMQCFVVECVGLATGLDEYLRFEAVLVH